MYSDLQDQADDILLKCRESLLRISIIEAERNHVNKNNDLNVQTRKLTSQHLTQEEIVIHNAIERESNVAHNVSTAKHDKKIAFHSSQYTPKIPEEYRPSKRKQAKTKSIQQKIASNLRYKDNVKQRKCESLQKEVEKIKTDNIVVNLSDK